VLRLDRCIRKLLDANVAIVDDPTFGFQADVSLARTAVLALRDDLAVDRQRDIAVRAGEGAVSVVR